MPWNEANPLRLNIVEDNTLLRENLVFLLNGEKNMEVCGSFGTAEEAFPEILLDKPDVLLVDIGLPGMSGIDLIRKIKSDLPETEIMVHTVFDARETVFDAIKAGATGYILKGASPRELIESIENLARGGAPMSPKIARAVIGEFQDADPADQYLLTPREKEILLELEKGLTYKELAAKLHISHHTIHTHIKKIYEKLHAKSRRDALTRARKKGII
ncbi:MAG: response regulator transcription factor [Desulfobulbaceae bacterium]